MFIVGIFSNLFSFDHRKTITKIDDNLFLDTSVGNLIDDWYEIWEENLDDFAYDCAVDSLNNLYVVGFTGISSGNRDILLIKYNQNGQQLWNQTWGGALDEYGCNLFIKGQDEIYVGGVTKSFGDPDGDAVVIKYNRTGHQQWNFTWGSDQDEVLQGIAVDSLGNIYIGGQTGYLDSTGDIYIVKFNNAREEQWNITYGNSERHDQLVELKIDKKDYIYITAGTETDGGIGDSSIVTFKYNSSGVLEWKKVWTTGANGVGCDLDFDLSNNVYVVGYYYPSSSCYGCIIKYDEDGNYQWEDTFGQIGGYENYWYGIAIDTNDEIYVGGRTTSHGVSLGVDCILFNYDTSGNQNWYRAWGSTGDEDYHSLICDYQDNLYCVGGTNSYGAGSIDIFVVKYRDNQSIDIISPENMTYSGPMSGYYPATYGLDNDMDGSNPAGWNINVSGLESVEVISSMNGHEKVMQLFDTESGENAQAMAYNIFSAQTSGSIEFWYMTSGYQEGCCIRACDIYNTHGTIYFFSRSGYFTFQNSTGEYTVATCNSDQWYHVRFDFDCDSDTYDIYIDGSLKANDVSFWDPVSSITTLEILTRQWGSSSDYWMYVDAVGFSWDPNYNVGDNVNEGLLLSFENDTVLDWMGYSLDGGPNITIQGNTTIPMPTGNGQHGIQVSGNNTWGTYYQSEIKNFTLDWEYTYLRPSINFIDMIDEVGLEMNINLNAVGFLDAHRQTILFPSLPYVDHDPDASYFYNIELYDAHFNKNPSILSNITIRFYYNPSEIDDPENLHLYHYLSLEGRWREEEFIHNAVDHYIEFTTTELSYFCLTEPSIFVFPIPLAIIILIIVLGAVGISIPASYVIFSKLKKKEKDSRKSIISRKITITTREITPLEQSREVDVKKKRITPEMLTPIKAHGTQRIDEPEHPKKAMKIKEEEITIIDEEYEKKIIEETKRTEQEITIEKESDFCIIHKGPITGIIYVCPKCKAKYCLNCATTLSQKDETCWVCDSPIKIETNYDEKKISENKLKPKAPLDNKRLKKIFRDKNILEAIERESDLSVSLLNKEFFDKVNQFDWDEKERQQFIREMVALPPVKRDKILNQMIKMSNYKEG